MVLRQRCQQRIKDGNWQDTPGKYFWQAYYYPKGGMVGILPSGIKSFRIVQ